MSYCSECGHAPLRERFTRWVSDLWWRRPWRRPVREPGWYPELWDSDSGTALAQAQVLTELVDRSFETEAACGRTIQIARGGAVSAPAPAPAASQEVR